MLEVPVLELEFDDLSLQVALPPDELEPAEVVDADGEEEGGPLLDVVAVVDAVDDEPLPDEELDGELDPEEEPEPDPVPN